MIRGKRNDAYGRQTLRVDCCGWESYREAVSYIDSVAGKNRGRQKLQISTGRRVYSQITAMPVISNKCFINSPADKKEIIYCQEVAVFRESNSRILMRDY